MEEVIEIVKTRHDENDYKYHVLPVVKNALILAEKLNADKEIVEMAAYLHDIGRAGKGSDDEDHDVLGEAEARKILTTLQVDQEKIEKVCHCISTHRRKDGRNPETLEAEVLVNADAMSHFDGFLWLWAIYYEQNDLKTALSLLMEKSEKDWDKKLTLPEAKEIIKPKYEAVKMLLESTEYYSTK